MRKAQGMQSTFAKNMLSYSKIHTVIKLDAFALSGSRQ
jgi:hypothetical protein